MGSCFSSSAADNATNSSDCCRNAPPAVKIVASDGSLREFAHAIKVHEVLDRVDDPACFLCSSDELHYDARIPALGAQVTLQPGQIYFLLPASMLGYRLTGADMAELAVKAVSALGSSPKQIKHKKGIRSMSIQVMPVANEPEECFPEITSVGLDANLSTIRSYDVSRYYDDGDKKKNMINSRTNRRGAAASQRKQVLRSYKVKKLGTIEEVAE